VEMPYLPGASLSEKKILNRPDLRYETLHVRPELGRLRAVPKACRRVMLLCKLMKICYSLHSNVYVSIASIKNDSMAQE
jgi:hypothetical protein